MFDAAKNFGLKNITIETGIDNLQAINTYMKKNFIKLSSFDIKKYLNSRNRNADVSDDYLIENDGSKYFVLKKEII